MMNKKNIISISGDLASGKGTVSEILMKKLGHGIYKNGDYFRKLAKEHNMTLQEFGEYVSTHPEIDIEIEESAKKYALNHDNFIIDARLGWYAVPESFKVYLKVDINEINEPTNPVNDENHANLLEIFGSSKCTTGIDNDTNTDYTECIDNDINLRVYTTAGSIGAFRDDFACIINDRILSCQYFI